MAMMKLTLVDPGAPAVSINPRHVVSVKPRRALRPNTATQGVDLINSWEGATVQLSTGAHHNVVEDHDTIVAAIDQATVPAVQPSDVGTISQGQVSGLTLDLASTPEPPATPTPPAAPEPPAPPTTPEVKKTAGPKKTTSPKPPPGAPESKSEEEDVD